MEPTGFHAALTDLRISESIGQDHGNNKDVVLLCFFHHIIPALLKCPRSCEATLR